MFTTVLTAAFDRRSAFPLSAQPQVEVHSANAFDDLDRCVQFTIF